MIRSQCTKLTRDVAFADFLFLVIHGFLVVTLVSTISVTVQPSFLTIIPRRVGLSPPCQVCSFPTLRIGAPAILAGGR